jgi:Ca-activated chloride channel family protein
MLTQIASMSNGSYFRATDTDSLKGIYNRIDELEKTEIEELIFTDYQDLYPRFLIPAFLLLLISVVSDKILFRTELA